jgi:hypothetical protein
VTRHLQSLTILDLSTSSGQKTSSLFGLKKFIFNKFYLKILKKLPQTQIDPYITSKQYLIDKNKQYKMKKIVAPRSSFSDDIKGKTLKWIF